MSGQPLEGGQVSTRPLDPDVVRVIGSSVSRLIEQEGLFIQQLHYDLATLIPALTTLVAGEGWPFCERIVRSVLWVTMTGEPAPVVAAHLRRVGAANRLEGFPDAKYPSVAHALVRTVRDLSGDSWSTSTGSAWISCFQWIEPHLIIGSQQAALRQRAAQESAQPPPGPPQAVAGEDALETVAGLLGDEEEDQEDGGYGQIMVSMTRPTRRDRPPEQG